MNYKLFLQALIVSALLLLLGSYLYKDHKVISPVNASTTPSWLKALEKNPTLYNLAKCESNLNPEALNPKDSNGLPSRGLLQFQSETWIAWTSELDPKRHWNIWSPKDQIEVATFALIHRRGHHWGCWSKI